MEYMLIVRFLGTTPTSSSIHSLLLSICQQICYNMEVNLFMYFKQKVAGSIAFLLVSLKIQAEAFNQNACSIRFAAFSSFK